ncbi:hypothetical protein EG878_14695 [Enterococcus faecalis]|nr:hypothetical protein EG878_14695 [Enterococcus faecalis]
MEAKNCFNCRYAVKAVDHPRKGMMVECQLAKELSGDGLVRFFEEARCGSHAEFKGDDREHPEPENKEKAKVAPGLVTCGPCKGTGKMSHKASDGAIKTVRCYNCDGKGLLKRKG